MRRLFIIGAVAVALSVLGGAPVGWAAGLWAAPVDGGAIVMPYAATYDGKTHHGVDLSAATGASVASPAAGSVVFAGQVPADGGGTCGAVTVELADGKRLSVLPLAEVFVNPGADVTPGEVVGTLASSGDDSVAEPHLHLGLRSGNSYVDPTGYLPVMPADAPSDMGDASGTAAGDGSGAGVPSTSASPAFTRVGATPAASAAAPAAGVAVVSGTVCEAPLAPARPRVIRHPIPEDSGVRAVSQIVQTPAAPAGTIDISDAVAGVAVGRTSPLALVAPGVALVLVGAFGLTRQFAHGRVS